MPSTWPLTRWPSSGSPRASDGSRFTRSPAASRPSVVTASVSAETSASKRSEPTAVAVRHTPLTAMLAPSVGGRISVSAIPIVTRLSPPRSSTASTVPIPLTIPENIEALRQTCTPDGRGPAKKAARAVATRRDFGLPDLLGRGPRDDTQIVADPPDVVDREPHPLVERFERGQREQAARR